MAPHEAHLQSDLASRLRMARRWDCEATDVKGERSRGRRLNARGGVVESIAVVLLMVPGTLITGTSDSRQNVSEKAAQWWVVAVSPRPWEPQASGRRLVPCTSLRTFTVDRLCDGPMTTTTAQPCAQ